MASTLGQLRSRLKCFGESREAAFAREHHVLALCSHLRWNLTECTDLLSFGSGGWVTCSSVEPGHRNQWEAADWRVTWRKRATCCVAAGIGKRAAKSFICSAGAHGYQLQVVLCVTFCLWHLECRYQTEPVCFLYWSKRNEVTEMCAFWKQMACFWWRSGKNGAVIALVHA